MRSLNAKRLAAVAAGAAMLGLALGTAFGACPDISKDWVYKADGSPQVNIVVGSDAKISDSIAAANLAAIIASKAYVPSGEKTITATAHGSVKLKVQGAEVTPKEGAYDDLSWNTYNKELVLGSTQGLPSGTITFNDNEYDYRTEIHANFNNNNGIKVGYEEDKDYHGIYMTNTRNKVWYEFQFVDPFPAVGDLNQTVEIPFLGSKYVIDQVKDDKVVLVKGEEANLGIGQSTTITTGNTTYTVTLKTASIDEANNVGYATVEVSDGTNTYTLNLNTGNTDSGTAGGLYVYLQSVQKDYGGAGGRATLRLGGEKLELEEGEFFPGSDTWKVELKYDTSTTPNKLKYIRLVLDKDYKGDDKVTKIVGPEGYFTVEYDGTQLDRGSVDYTKVEVTGDGERDASNHDHSWIEKLTYSDTYNNKYTVDLYDTGDDQINAFLANSNGAVAKWDGTYSGSYTVTNSSVTDTNLTVDDINYSPGIEGLWNITFNSEYSNTSVGNWSVYYNGSFVGYINDTANQTTWQLNASDGGYINITMTDTNSTGNETTGAHFLINVTNVAKVYDYVPLVQGKYFFVNDTPVEVDYVNYNGGNSKVRLKVAGATVEEKEGWNCSATVTSSDYLDLKSTVTTLCKKDITFTTPAGSANITVYVADADNLTNLNEDAIYVTSGADNELDLYTDNWKITWPDTNYWSSGGYGIGPEYIQISDGTNTWKVTYEYNETNDQDGIKVDYGADGSYEIDQSDSDSASDENNKYDMEEYGYAEATSRDTVDITIPKEALENRVRLYTGTSGGQVVAPNEKVLTTEDEFPYEVATGVTVEDLTCEADPVKVSTGYTFGTVPTDMVILDSQTPSEPHVIVIGSYYVNKLAVGHTEELTAAGQEVCKFSDDGNTLYVAGYTAQDTINVVNELIEKIKAL